jgi:hypothetical protein
MNGYPEKVIYKTPLNNEITISQNDGYIKIVYLTKEGKTEYKILETKNNRLIMNK